MFNQNSPIEIIRAQVGDAHAIAKVHVASWRTTYRGIIDDTLLEKLSISNREKQWKKILEENNGLNSCWIVKQGGRVIGFADGGKSRENKSIDFDAELYAIYLLKDSG